MFNALHPALAKNKVVIVPTVLERKCEEVGRSKNGAAIIKVICKVKYDICAEDGSRVSSIIYGEGMDREIKRPIRQWRLPINTSVSRFFASRQKK